MQQSESINELAAALVAFQGEVGAVPKGSVNPFFKSKYSDLADVKSYASRVVASHGLAVTQFPTTEDGEPALLSLLVHTSGQWISAVAKLMVKTNDPQGQGSGLTYMRRYAYMAILGLVSDVDDDGNQATQRSREYESSQHTEPAGVNLETGELDPRLEAILLAAAQGATGFIADLASKYNQYGSLSVNQLNAGFDAASKIIGNETHVKASESTYKGGKSIPNEPS
jgi:hypothetical protein